MNTARRRKRHLLKWACTVLFAISLVAWSGTQVADVSWTSHDGSVDVLLIRGTIHVFTGEPIGSTRSWCGEFYSRLHSFDPFHAYGFGGNGATEAGRWLWDANMYSLPLWPALLVAGVPAICLWIMGRRRRVRPSHCKKCGYDLRATPDRCPECGTPTMRPTGQAPSPVAAPRDRTD
jgi:hypothetical protein